MIIDMFAHIRGPKYSKELEKRTGRTSPFPDPMKDTLEGRFEGLEAQYNGECLEVISTMQENIDNLADELALCRVCNDEYAELIQDYPKYFLSGAALLPTLDIKEAEKEAERAITQLGLKGLLLGSHVQGDLLGNERFFGIYEIAAHYDVPIFIHPYHRYPEADFGPFDYSVETAKTMMDLSSSGVFEKFPNIKFITHHGGGVVPLMYPRMLSMYYISMDDPMPQSTAEEIPSPPGAEGMIRKPRWSNEQGMQYFNNLKKFYFDTAFDGVCIDGMKLRLSFFGVDKAVFGADFPAGPTSKVCIKNAITTIEGQDISEEDKQKIYYGNAKRILNLD